MRNKWVSRFSIFEASITDYTNSWLSSSSSSLSSTQPGCCFNSVSSCWIFFCFSHIGSLFDCKSRMTSSLISNSEPSRYSFFIEPLLLFLYWYYSSSIQATNLAKHSQPRIQRRHNWLIVKIIPSTELLWRGWLFEVYLTTFKITSISSPKLITMRLLSEFRE